MNARAFIRAVLVVVMPATLAAQTPGMRPGAILVSAGVGSGSAALACAGCASRRDASLAELLRLGVAVQPTIALAAELSGWTKNFADPQGTAKATFLFVSATAQWHPRLTSGLFLKAGGGVARISDDITMTSLGETSITTTAPAVVLGLGWNVASRGQWGLTPYLDYNHAMQGTQTVNGVQAGQKLGGNLLSLGVAASLGGRPRMQPHVPVPVIVAVNQDSIDRARAEQARLDSIAEARRRQGELQRQKDQHDRVIADSIARVREAEAIVARETEVMRVTLSTALYFDFDKTDLRDDARQALEAKVPILLANPDVTVRIAGHTDDRGSEAVNFRLSQERAAVARDYLVTRGVNTSRIVIVNFGKTQPVCASIEESCRAKNRRTEFEITGGATVLRKP